MMMRMIDDEDDEEEEDDEDEDDDDDDDDDHPWILMTIHPTYFPFETRSCTCELTGQQVMMSLDLPERRLESWNFDV